MTEKPALTLSFLLLNLLLVGSWAGLALPRVPAAAVVAVAIVFLTLEVALWLGLADSKHVDELHETNLDRIASLLSRSGDKHRQSIRDEATGLYSRWYLDSRLEQEALRCKRYGHSVAVVVVRLGLVELTDMSMDGWQEEQIAAARKCAQTVRKIDLSGALGPLEFVLVLVHCDRVGAEKALIRLYEDLPEYRAEAGISVFPDDGCEPRALIDLARVRSRTPASSPLEESVAA